jgi:hypothetical protein
MIEVARVLRPGGLFYIDLVPNRLYWNALQHLHLTDAAKLSDIVQREIRMVNDNAKMIEQDFGIDAETFIAAEPGKKFGGIDPVEFRALVTASGFSNCEIHFDWFLGQGSVMHNQSFAEAETIDRYLKRVSPMADALYKYLYVIATR